MAKISGVSVELITKLGGVSKQLVRKLGSKLTTELGFGPNYNPGPSCETLSMSYSNVSLADAVNNGTGINVEIGDNGIWYAEGSCGNFTAGTGYYFLDDGNREVFYFYWDAETEELSELDQRDQSGPAHSLQHHPEYQSYRNDMASRPFYS